MKTRCDSCHRVRHCTAFDHGRVLMCKECACGDEPEPEELDPNNSGAQWVYANPFWPPPPWHWLARDPRRNELDEYG